MKIVPQQSRIVVEPIPHDSLIVIPDMELKDEDGNKVVQPKRYRVVAVGTGRVLDSGVVVEIPLKKGDEVMIDMRYALQAYPPFVGGETLYIVDYAGVVARIERHHANDGLDAYPAPPIAVAKRVLVGAHPGRA